MTQFQQSYEFRQELRSKLIRCVISYCDKAKVPYNPTFDKLYAEFYRRTQVDLVKQASIQNSVPLDIAECLGMLVNLYDVAVDMFTNPTTIDMLTNSTAIKALYEAISVDSIKLDVYQLVDGECRWGIGSVMLALGFPVSWTEDTSKACIEVEVDGVIEKTISTEAFVTLIYYSAINLRKPEGIKLALACITKSLNQLSESAFSYYY